MKKIAVYILVSLLVFGFTSTTSVIKAEDSCVEIKDQQLVYGVSHYLAGNTIPLGYDDYGYNYNAHSFNGYFINLYTGNDGLPPYNGDDEAYVALLGSMGKTTDDIRGWDSRHETTMQKWNEAYLSNKDCDNNGKLDMHYGLDSYVGSGAWYKSYQTSALDHGIDKKILYTYVSVPEGSTGYYPMPGGLYAWFSPSLEFLGYGFENGIILIRSTNIDIENSYVSHFRWNGPNMGLGY